MEDRTQSESGKNSVDLLALDDLVNQNSTTAADTRAPIITAVGPTPTDAIADGDTAGLKHRAVAVRVEE